MLGLGSLRKTGWEVHRRNTETLLYAAVLEAHSHVLYYVVGDPIAEYTGSIT